MRGDEMRLTVNGRDETRRAGNITRADNLDGLSVSLTFDIAVNPDDRYWPKTNIVAGDKVVFTNGGKAVFSGIITDMSQNSRYAKSYTANDYGWYLNKNEVVVQFRKMIASDAIKKLCNDFGVPVGAICSLPTKISKVYNGDTLSDCIKDIIKQTEADQGKSYRMELRDNKLYVEPYSDLVVRASFKPAANLAPFDPTRYPADERSSESIADMANVTKVVSASEQSAQIIGKAQDSASVARYGMLQKVEQAEQKDSAQAGNLAKNLLLELNKVTKTKTVKLLGDDKVRSGRILYHQGVAYLVTSCTHTYNGAVHTMDLTLEAI